MRTGVVPASANTRRVTARLASEASETWRTSSSSSSSSSSSPYEYVVAATAASVAATVLADAASVRVPSPRSIRASAVSASAASRAHAQTAFRVSFRGDAFRGAKPGAEPVAERSVSATAPPRNDASAKCVASATSAATAPLFAAAAHDTRPSRARSRTRVAAFARVSTSAAPSASARGVRRSSPRCAAFPAEDPREVASADAPNRRPSPAEADLRGATPRCIADPDASVS